MSTTPEHYPKHIASNHIAVQHGPRPLPLFLSLLWQQTQHDPMLRGKALAGLRRYQHAERPHAPAREIVARAGRASLRVPADAPRPGPGRQPVILIPSLINPPDVMDIAQDRSLLRYLLRSGYDAMLVDWGTPDESVHDMDLAAHVEALLLPLIAQAGPTPILIGYCLGGTLAIAAGAALSHRGTPAGAIATIAAPWHFSNYDDAFRAETARIWQSALPLCEQLRCVPMEVLQTGFWSLDPARTVAKFAAFADMEEDAAAYRTFITLEDWANAGAPLTLSAGKDLSERCYAQDLPGKGLWEIGGQVVNPARLGCPTLAIASTSDRIVPAEAAPAADERIDLALGHVGMMVGGRAEATLFAPLTAWVARQMTA